MNNKESAIVEAAVIWLQVIAQDEMDMDWVAFTGWLKADLLHRTAFDEIASIDAAAAEHRSAIRFILDDLSVGNR